MVAEFETIHPGRVAENETGGEVFVRGEGDFRERDIVTGHEAKNRRGARGEVVVSARRGRKDCASLPMIPASGLSSDVYKRSWAADVFFRGASKLSKQAAYRGQAPGVRYSRRIGAGFENLLRKLAFAAGG